MADYSIEGYTLTVVPLTIRVDVVDSEARINVDHMNPVILDHVEDGDWAKRVLKCLDGYKYGKHDQPLYGSCIVTRLMQPGYAASHVYTREELVRNAS